MTNLAIFGVFHQQELYDVIAFVINGQVCAGGQIHTLSRQIDIELALAVAGDRPSLSVNRHAICCFEVRERNGAFAIFAKFRHKVWQTFE